MNPSTETVQGRKYEFKAEEFGAEQYSLSGDATARSVRLLRKAAMSIIFDQVLEGDVTYSFELSLQEACANVVKHAYGEDGEGALCVCLCIVPERSIGFEVVDKGCGFQCPGGCMEPPKEGATNGRGLLIMSQAADSFSVRQEQGRNIVSVDMLVPPEAWKHNGDDAV